MNAATSDNPFQISVPPQPPSLQYSASIMSGIIGASLDGISFLRHDSYSGNVLATEQETKLREEYERVLETHSPRDLLVEVANNLSKDLKDKEYKETTKIFEKTIFRPFCMGMHPRLGANSCIRWLSPELVHMICKYVEQDSIKTFTWKIKTDDIPVQEFTFNSDRIVTIGRYNFSDVGLKEHPGTPHDAPPCCSRMHVIVIPLKDSLVLCDVGSLSGFSIIERSGKKIDHDMYTSIPGKRRILLVGSSNVKETVIVRLHPRDRDVIIDLNN